MAGYDLIDAYLSELRVSLGSFAAADTVLEEAEDHLLEAVEHLEVAGLSCRDAQVQALARFGSAALVSKVCVTESRKGAAVSTTFTRRAGLIATTTPLLLLLGLAGNQIFSSTTSTAFAARCTACRRVSSFPSGCARS